MVFSSIGRTPAGAVTGGSEPPGRIRHRRGHPGELLRERRRAPALEPARPGPRPARRDRALPEFGTFVMVDGDGDPDEVAAALDRVVSPLVRG
ncbi:hypothetical protein [Micromonospora sp. IBHARD004]|uniref:hypothetical protein n=1 Tax=Micromonospora sp. IBHARD004 TaxID=3457764 RepID=UPI0040587B5F